MIARTDQDRLRAAYHEAGHAVMAMVHDIPVLSMEISPPDWSVGCTGIDFAGWLDMNRLEQNEYPRHYAELAIMTYFAGPAAGFLFAPRPGLDGRIDFERGMGIAAEFETEPAVHYYVNYLWMKTGQQLAAPDTWTTVAALAEALVDGGALDAKAIKRVCERKRRHRSPVGSIEFIELSVEVFGNDVDPEHLVVGDRLWRKAAAGRVS